MVSVKELRKIAEDKKNIKKQCFKKMLELVNNKIIITSKANVTSVWFEIPFFMLGYPSYEVKEISDYIKIKLEKKEFTVNFLEPNILLISW